MPKFRKKPVVIEAVRTRDALLAASRDWMSMPPWLRDGYEQGLVLFVPEAALIQTAEGTMRADLDDWIIQGVKGELYPCKPDIFEATYDPVPDCAPGQPPRARAR